jgi:hypothetical protein
MSCAHDGRMIRLSPLLLAALVGCGAPPENEQPTLPSAAVDLTKAAREAAVIEVVSARFKANVADVMAAQNLSVRGLARAAGLKKPTNELAASLSPAKYDAHASCAKVEVVAGKVFYTAIASSLDSSAAVLGEAASPEAYVVSYEVEAELSPAGELDAFVFHQLGTATPIKRAALLERSGKSAPVGQCHDVALR